MSALPIHPHAETYDLIVVGGGVAGSVAAIAAARAGARVLRIEEQGFLGGFLTATGGGPMMSFHNPAGEQVVRGMPDELIARLQRRGASPGHIADTTTYCSTVTPIAMAIGQGGGVAAAEAVRLGVPPMEVPCAVIRRRLEAQGALLPPAGPASTVPPVS